MRAHVDAEPLSQISELNESLSPPTKKRKWAPATKDKKLSKTQLSHLFDEILGCRNTCFVSYFFKSKVYFLLKKDK